MFRLFQRQPSRAEAIERFARQQYLQMDFGRVFGWWLCIDGLRVAELNYRRWYSYSQFWHEYDLVPSSEKFSEIGTDPERWAFPDVSAESRYAHGYIHAGGLLMSPRGEGIVALRCLLIPEDEFVAAFEKIHTNAPTPPPSASPAPPAGSSPTTSQKSSPVATPPPSSTPPTS